MAIDDNPANNLEAGLKILEELTINADEIQNHLLQQILSQNSNTEYLSRFQLHSHKEESIDVKSVFKKRVPIVEYEDIKSYIQRVASGEPSHIICSQPVTEFVTSNGTSSGHPKLIPLTAEDSERRAFFINLAVRVIINKYIKGLDEGKGMYLTIIREETTTPSGLVARTVSTRLFKNLLSQNRSFNHFTSPKETILCPDNKQSMYCQLLCGLVQRDEVVRIGAVFASAFLRVIQFLEGHWKEMCSNIRKCHVSDWITDINCRNATCMVLLGKATPEMADLIETECGGRSWEGIVKRLWPRAKYIDVIVTGSMAQYVPNLEFYTGGLIPLVSLMYVSSECSLGINLKPLSKPSDVSYTLIPNMAYFEFLPVDKNHEDDIFRHYKGSVPYPNPNPSSDDERTRSEDVVTLVDVQVGHFYELLITTFTGLYRYKVGDILMVTGFHNNAPQFRFVERRNVVLSIATDRTNEDNLMKAVTQAKFCIEQHGFTLSDYTSYADKSTIPAGHYVLFWELNKKKGDHDQVIGELDRVVMEECCSKVEEKLDWEYRRCRKNEKSVGALEIRVVKHGTFDELMEYYVTKGSSVSQYKTPRCVKSMEAVSILDSGVVGNYFSNSVPSWDPFLILEPSAK